MKDSNIVEKGQVEYVFVSALSLSAPSPSNLGVCSAKSEKRKVSHSAVKLTRRFDTASPSKLSHRHPVVEEVGYNAAFGHQQSRGK